jgi:hypothetical protein
MSLNGYLIRNLLRQGKRDIWTLTQYDPWAETATMRMGCTIQDIGEHLLEGPKGVPASWTGVRDAAAAVSAATTISDASDASHRLEALWTPFAAEVRALLV